ncbi:unnamed protein product [Brachionus calyciflorus]|uniref:Calcitonin receptor n=1 Tax=Brachionus calyciflorus TaxID=104777 RepID=A0A813XFF3_9BILA|nr:unnamed protein product [Brachionus calyciflorus]
MPNQNKCRLSRFGSFEPTIFNRLSCSNCYNLLSYVFPETDLVFEMSHDGHLASSKFNVTLDPTDQQDIQIVKNSMRQIEFDKWRACCDSAEDCCSKVMSQSILNFTTPKCNSIWDGWSCHPDTKSGDISKVKCPLYVAEDTCTTVFEYAYFQCESDGQWYRNEYGEWTNYTGCMQSFLDIKERLINVNIISHTFSLIFLIIGLGIFFHYKQLRVHRILLHKNFFVSLISHSLIQIIWESIIMRKNLHSAEKYIETNHPGCILINLLLQYTRSTNYFWMFSESLYLYKLLISVFKEESNLYVYYFIGWGIPFIICSTYATFTYIFNNNSCWTNNDVLVYILNVPNIFTILLNFGFLISIIRVLYKKLTASNTTEPHQYRKAVRATLILVPLFGLHLILSPYVMCESAPGSQVHNLINRLVESLQGFVVALIYCFFNGEVVSLLKKSIYSTRLFEIFQGRTSKMKGSLNLPGYTSNNKINNLEGVDKALMK